MSTEQQDGSTASPMADTEPARGTSSGPTTPPAAGDYPTFLPIDAAHYVIGREVARGGMGRIRVARDRRLGRSVALKEILLEASSDDLRRFAIEARITARLTHPSIVNLHEAGLWPSGEPFYAMALVAGESLDAVVDRAGTLEHRLALLPNVLAVADAMAYAHGERIIHRDLKPKNVLIGSFGETVVIDWGLAKDLTMREPDAPPPAVPLSGETVAGSVMGTPVYMPPEQALGLPVDPRADVYAIGALLDHVLSGKPPYDGHSAWDILEKVRRGPPLPLAQRQPGLPAELLAIVERAMARDPKARYPTARELAEDLRRYQTGQLVGAHRYSLGQLLSRWLRRHRAAVSVAAAAAVVLLLVGALALRSVIAAQHLAEEQKARAVSSRNDAEDLLGFMLHDLPTKLAPLGRLDVLDDVAKKAIAYYDGKTDLVADDDVRRQALAQRRLGLVLAEQHHYEATAARFRASSAALAAIVAREPGNVPVRRELAASYLGLGDALLNQSDTTAAIASYRAALELAGALARERPDDLELQEELANSHRRLGNGLRWLDPAAGLEQIEAALAVNRSVVTRAPTNDASLAELSKSLTELGRARLAQGDSTGALTHLREAQDGDARRLAGDPANALIQRDLLLSALYLGDGFRASGQTASALEQYRAAEHLAATLAANDPSSAERQTNLAEAQMRVGQLLVSEGDTTGALAAFRSARAARERLSKNDPTSLELLGRSDDAIGLALSARGDLAGALESFKSSVELLEQALAREPSNVEWLRELSVSRDDAGDVLVLQKNGSAALVQFRAALAIREAALAREPNDIERVRDVSVSHEKIGDALMALGDTRAALEEYRAVVALDEAQLQRDPTNAKRLRDRTYSYDKVGEALLALGEARAALVEFRAEVALQEVLLAQNPQNPELQAELADTREKAGDALLALGDEAARAEFEAARSLRKVLMTQDPKEDDERRAIGQLEKKLKACRGASWPKR